MFARRVLPRYWYLACYFSQSALLPLPPAPISPRAPRAPKGRRCRGRRCPPLGTSRSPVARDGGEGMGVVQSVGGAAGGRIWKGRAGEGRRGHGVVFHSASPSYGRAAWERSPLTAATAATAWSDLPLPLRPQLQLLQQLHLPLLRSPPRLRSCLLEAPLRLQQRAHARASCQAAPTHGPRAARRCGRAHARASCQVARGANTARSGQPNPG